MKAPVLKMDKVGIQFGGLKAVDQLTLEIPEGVLYGLIGPNGAGKTTAFNLMTGVYQPTSGQVYFRDQPLNGLKAYKRARMGVCRTFQNIRLFQDLTVLENTLIALHSRLNYGLLSTLLKLPKYRNQEEMAHAEAIKLLSVFDLQNKKDERAGSLPYGQQRKLEIVRALATKPHLLLLDEPAAGMNHAETAELMNTIAHIRKSHGVTILLIEHDMKLVMGICEKIFVLDHGCLIAQGTAQDIQNNKNVIEAYLGVDE